MVGAGEGNRTLVVSLGSFCSAIELHPAAAPNITRWGELRKSHRFVAFQVRASGRRERKPPTYPKLAVYYSVMSWRN